MKGDTKSRLYAVEGATAVPEVAPEQQLPDAADAAAGVADAPGDPLPDVRGRKAKTYGPLADPALEEMVRRYDEDRWLASRFAPKALRQQLIALYAFNVEVASVSEKVSEPRLGEIRLQWWRDTVDTIFHGGPTPDHPVMRALADLRAQAELPLDIFDVMLTARVSDLSRAPFDNWSDVDNYIDATDGGLMRMAAMLCQPTVPISPQRGAALQAAARAWGYVNLLRSMTSWTAQQRTFFPRALRASIGLGADPAEIDDAGIAIAAHATLDRANGAQKNLERFATALGKELFPAVGYAALTPLYVREQSQRELGQIRKPVSLLQRQLRLVGAAAKGHV
ncbi:MAG: squalene/phytoene synthase family protein [Alphaproteobacteria bacterium]